MKYFLDCEFHESGYDRPIELISLAVVCDDGREFYAVAADGWSPATASDWLKENVVPHLAACGVDKNVYGWFESLACSRVEMAKELSTFVRDEGGSKPEFWGYFSSYDWVIFCQLFGRMIDLPKHFPKHCLDIKQRCVSLGNPKLPKQTTQEHNALSDARHNQVMHKFLDVHEVLERTPREEGCF
jgi:hypothetical protein